MSSVRTPSPLSTILGGSISNVTIPLGNSVPHPLWSTLPSDTECPSRVLVMAPSVDEQRLHSVDEETALSWLKLVPTSIAHSTLQFEIFTYNDMLSPRRIGRPCGVHPPPVAALLAYIVTHYHDLPQYIVSLPSYSQYQRDEEQTDRLQVLIRLKWSEFTALRPYMPLDGKAYRCQDVASLRSARLSALQQVWSLISSSSVSETYPFPSPLPTRLCYSGGDEFVVSRQRVQQRPVSLYTQLQSALCPAAGESDSSQSTSEVASALSSLWHVLFGEDSVLPSSSAAPLMVDIADLPFYGPDKMDPEVWTLTTSPLTAEELSLPAEYRDVPPQWMPHFGQVQREHSSPASDTFASPDEISRAVVVAASFEDLSFLHEVVDPQMSQLVYRMVHPLVHNHSASTVGLYPTPQQQRRINKDSDLTNARIHHSQGHCNEASSFLLFMIQYYHQLPEFIFFIHGHRASWHNNDISLVLNHLDWDFIVQKNRTQNYPFYFSLNTLHMYEVDAAGWTILAAQYHDIFPGTAAAL